MAVFTQFGVGRKADVLTIPGGGCREWLAKAQALPIANEGTTGQMLGVGLQLI